MNTNSKCQMRNIKKGMCLLIFIMLSKTDTKQKKCDNSINKTFDQIRNQNKSTKTNESN